MKAIFNFSLGKDFWNFRLGQLVSLLGDSCSQIALAWWILDKTHSASAMSSVLAPAMLVRIFLLPLMGPLGDNFSRKHLIMIADFWRFGMTSILAAIVYFDMFNIPLLIVIFILNSIGSALFNAAIGGIVPQLVSRDKLQMASEQTQMINSFAGVIGGIIGGVAVSVIGIFGAFALDALSYLVAAILAGSIKANTKAERKEFSGSKNHFTVWKNELISGFKIINRIPVLFWLCIVAMLMNLSLSPLGIVLPVLAKQGRNMPAWFLGGLESSIAMGAIIGALTLSTLQRYIRPHFFLIFSIAMIGCGVFFLPWVPNLFLPLSLLFWIGVGSSWANIPLGTQIALTVPNSYLSRVGSIMGFMCSGISPLGIAAAGFLISKLGLTKSLMYMGGFLVLLTPLILLIPKFKEFMGSTQSEAGQFLSHNYPDAF